MIGGGGCIISFKTKVTNEVIKNSLIALDKTVVHNTGNEYIQGEKTFTSDIDGNVSGYANKLKTPRIISLTGDVTGSSYFDGSKDISIETSFSGIPSGATMLFAQAAAPVGWTKKTDVTDAAVRIVSGGTGGKTTGSIAFSTMFSSSFALPMSGNVGATTLTVAQMPSHRHGLWAAYDGCSGGAASLSHACSGSWYTNMIKTDGGGESHTHSLSGSATVNLSIKYIDIILCQKN